jgi:hypothetical protein
MLTPAVLALLVPAADPIVLARGQRVEMPGGPARYEAVYDTYIEASTGDANHGGEPSLLGGPARTILIKFGDLARVVPITKRVRRAELVFTMTGGEAPELRSIGRVRSPWGEGPYQTLGALLRRNNTPESDGKTPTAPRGSATWRQRRAGEGGATWRDSGVIGGAETERVADAKAEIRTNDVAVTGLAAAVQAMVDRPLENHGFALSFSRAAEFASSQSPFGRPRLVLELEDAPAPTGSDLSVTLIERASPSGKPPVEGDEVTYTAHVKNVGDAPSEGFAAVWIVGEREGATVDMPKPLAPGAEATLTIRRPYKPEKTDHRFQPLQLRITPKGRDASPRNDALEVQEGAKWVELALSRTTVTALTGTRNALGSTAVEDWVQSQVATMNEVYLDRSRFSFAPDGARERVAIGKIDVIDGGAMTPKTDGTLQMLFAGGSPAGEADRPFLRSLGLALGLPPLAGSDITVQENDLVPRASVDPYAGLMGYGDTRFEGAVPGLTIIPYEPVSNPIFDLNPLEPTGLLTATDVATLNGRLDGTIAADALPPLPKSIIARAQDLAGRPLTNVELSFFQSSNGRIATGTPAFTVVTGSTGSVLLPGRDELSPFGKLDANGGNHTFLVRAARNGVTEWAWLKAWQVIDTATRGTSAAAIVDLRFNLPGAALEAGSNLAKERIVTDAAQSLPARLAPITDEDPKTEAALSAKVGDWVEIDLGRDRTIGEVSLLVRPGQFWNRFDIQAYATGQKPEDATPWAREVDFGWTADNRRDPVAGANGVVAVSYRGQPRRFRYLRLVNRSGGEGRLADVRVVPAVVTAGTP